MINTLEIYFRDLTEEAQNEALRCVGVSDPSEMNWEFSPIAIVDFETNDDELEEE